MKIIFCVASFLILSVSTKDVIKRETQTLDFNNDVYFNLYTRRNPTEPQRLYKGNNETLKMSNFQLRKPLKIFVHGFDGPSDSPELRDAFLKESDVNVVVVNWTAGTTGAESTALLSAPGVGRYIASFIDWVALFGPVYRNIHLIGVDLGCHVVGYTGRNCKKGHIKYITACDPTKNTFETSEDKLNRLDARYVEVIHTNSLNMGLASPTGHTDFYPNGGIKMPGCPDTPQEGSCSHLKAFEYFLESLNRRSFKGFECVSYEELMGGRCSKLTYLHMGGMNPKKRTGVYLVETNPQKPYSKE